MGLNLYMHRNTFRTNRAEISLPVSNSEREQIEGDTATFSGLDWTLTLRSTEGPHESSPSERVKILDLHARTLLEAEFILPEGIRFTPKIVWDRKDDEPSLFIMGISESRRRRILCRILSTVEGGTWWLHAARFCHLYQSPEHDDIITDAMLSLRRS
jgi:hypothetical protein